MAAFEGDAHVVRQAQRETRARLGDLFRHQTGSVFLCDAAACLALVGADDAHEMVREALNRDDVEPLEAGIAQIIVQARIGDPSSVRGLVDELHRTVDVPAERSWRLELEVALSRFRESGQWQEDQVHAVLLEAERFGLSELARRLLERAGRSVDPEVRLELFGHFAAFRGTERIDATRRSSDLLAVRNRPVHIDVVVDHLWPEAEADRGRNRLRNCVNRARSALGHDAILRNDQTLALSPAVATDLRAFEIASQSATDDMAADEALRALELYADHLLATDLYSDWLLPEREAYRSSAETLISRLAAEKHGSASELLTHAIRIGAMPRVIERIESAAEDQGDAVTATACRAELQRTLLD